ncbi:hypothetical protein P7C71_g2701, partial [Lecanoromycetidae sp. Uapishka_2]
MDYLGEDTGTGTGEENYASTTTHSNATANLPALNHESHAQTQVDQSNGVAQANEDNNALDEYNGMPPPADAEFAELSDLLKYTQDHAARYGYATVTASNNYKRGIAYVRCDRGGKYVNHWNLTDENRVRKQRQRRLVGCLWKARAKKNSEGMWVMTMMHDKHNNHGPSTDPASHPSQRQLSDEAKEAARKAFHDKQSPKFVLGLLQTNFNPAVTAQDVYNLKAKINREDEASVAQGGQGLPPVGPNTQMTNATNTTTSEPEIPTDPALQQLQIAASRSPIDTQMPMHLL